MKQAVQGVSKEQEGLLGEIFLQRRGLLERVLEDLDSDGQCASREKALRLNVACLATAHRAFAAADRTPLKFLEAIVFWRSIMQTQPQPHTMPSTKRKTAGDTPSPKRTKISVTEKKLKKKALKSAAVAEEGKVKADKKEKEVPKAVAEETSLQEDEEETPAEIEPEASKEAAPKSFKDLVRLLRVLRIIRADNLRA